jgi:hypothetical protein
MISENGNGHGKIYLLVLRLFLYGVWPFLIEDIYSYLSSQTYSNTRPHLSIFCIRWEAAPV